MITEWFLDIFASLIASVLGTLPRLGLPAYLTQSGPGTLSGLVTSLLQSLGGLGGWLPASQVMAACAVIAGALAVAAVVYVARVVLSYLTLGGGAT